MKIDTSNLPGNSNLQKSEAKRDARKSIGEGSPIAVAKGHARKGSGKSFLANVFIAQDLGSVASFVFERVVVPALQRLAVDAINGVARGVFMGEGAIGDSSSRSPISSGYTNYNSIYDANSPKTRTRGAVSSEYPDIIFDDYGDARLALDYMDDCISNKGYLTLAEMYGCADMTAPYTAEYVGWTDISKAKIVGDADGYWIKMPRYKDIRNIKS